jgi:hypothetical protein
MRSSLIARDSRLTTVERDVPNGRATAYRLRHARSAARERSLFERPASNRLAHRPRDRSRALRGAARPRRDRKFLRQTA